MKPKEIAKSDAIGDLYRLEGSCPDLFDWGTHWFDMFFFYNDDEPAEWAMGRSMDGARRIYSPLLAKEAACLGSATRMVGKVFW